MAIELNHTIVPTRDKVASAKFFAKIFGLPFDERAAGYFAPVRVNKRLTFDFDDDVGQFDIHHYAFKVSEADFDAIFSRIQAEGIRYGSEPHA
jgi:catechol 2,3-dioxygenase-like lactoylglutathione lyase family enzyme